MPGESLRGYMKRIAVLYRATSINPLLAVCGVEATAAEIGHLSELGRLADALAMPSDMLDAMRFKPASARFGSIKGQSIESIFVRHDAMHVCGSCLAEGPYHRLIWDLAFVIACPKHGETLLSRCTKCGANLAGIVLTSRAAGHVAQI
jgi:hypothetical protein